MVNNKRVLVANDKNAIARRQRIPPLFDIIQSELFCADTLPIPTELNIHGFFRETVPTAQKHLSFGINRNISHDELVGEIAVERSANSEPSALLIINVNFAAPFIGGVKQAFLIHGQTRNAA